MRNASSLLVFAVLVAACTFSVTACSSEPAGISGSDFDVFRAGNRFGWGGKDEFLDTIQPILAKRCVVCHGCTDSPCQLKLTSYEGLLRGSNDSNIFSSTVRSQPPNRLKDGRVTDADGTINHDATEARWRSLEYYPVTDSQDDNSIMTKLLVMADSIGPAGRDPAQSLATYQLYERGLKDRKFECVGANNVGTLAGVALESRAMPFGLEPLETGDFEKIVDWIRRGAPGPDTASQKTLRTPRNPVPIAKWEEFFNGAAGVGLDLKRYLMARYLYEHMFFAHIHFNESAGEFYELLRSRTPPGEGIDEIVTEYVMDDPEVGRVYYRLRKIDAVIARKTHTVWDLDDTIMAHYDDLFLQGITLSGTVGYTVTEDPGYSANVGNGSNNPFRYFSQIPGVIRSQFMIENAEDLIDSLVEADVCTGSTATYAIRDHFWVWFLKPSSDPSAVSTDAVTEGLFFWDLNPFALHSILETDDESDYQEQLEEQMRILHPNGLSLDDIWVGDGNSVDPNSWLTILRHGKSATVERGAQGGLPETAWILSYTNFERLYYDLTVNFLNWQGALDQLETWTYMSNVRTEGEDLMLSLFPADQRSVIRDQWTAGFDTFWLYDRIGAFQEGRLMSTLPNSDLGVGGNAGAPRGSTVVFGTPTPVLSDLVELMVGSRPSTFGYGDVLNSNSSPGQVIATISTFDDFEAGLNAVTGSTSEFARNLPNITVLRVTDGGVARFYTVVSNRGYNSNDFIFGSDRARACDRDTLSAFRGIVGNYPELFVDLPLPRATEFLRDVQSVRNIMPAPPGEMNWLDFSAKYLTDGIVIARESPAFWPFVDDMHAFLSDPAQNTLTEAAIVDLSEYVWLRGTNSFDECTP